LLWFCSYEASIADGCVNACHNQVAWKGNQMYPSREQAAALGEATRQILAAGRYLTADGTTVELQSLLAHAIAQTRSYPAERVLPTGNPGSHDTLIRVVNASTLAAVAGLVANGQQPVVLNFASAKHPGGGWLSGARAQEESLARASGLVPCLEGNPLYARNAALGDALYTDDMIYSPEVPVFRDDAGALLAPPYLCAFITAPAVNAGVVLERNPQRRAEIQATMARRIARVLAIAAQHDHQALVLGAWGCGVFRNDPQQIAALFAAALAGPFQGAFAEVVFAILDHGQERRFIGPFEHVFAPNI
jgi:uncharacterized protein (TIGR02452 family)